MSMRQQCEAGEADWVVDAVIGKTFCPETEAGLVCPDFSPEYPANTPHMYQYGTDTSDPTWFFQGEKPTAEEIRELITDPNDPGWYLIEFKPMATRHGKFSHLWEPAEDDE